MVSGNLVSQEDRGVGVGGGARVWQGSQASGQGSQLQSAIPGLGSQLGVAIYCKLLWGVRCSLSRDPASSRTTVKPAFLSQEEGADMCQSGLQVQGLEIGLHA